MSLKEYKVIYQWGDNVWGYKSRTLTLLTPFRIGDSKVPQSYSIKYIRKDLIEAILILKNDYDRK